MGASSGLNVSEAVKVHLFVCMCAYIINTCNKSVAQNLILIFVEFTIHEKFLQHIISKLWHMVFQVL